MVNKFDRCRLQIHSKFAGLYQYSKAMWTTIEGKLYKEFKFKNFVEAFAFMTKVALIAERVNHHPEFRNVYNTVEIYLYTHDAENSVTEKDKHLAEKIDQVFKTAIVA